MKRLLLATVIYFIYSTESSATDKYGLALQRARVAYANPEYYSKAEMVNFKLNRYTNAINASFNSLQAWPNDSYVQFTCMEFLNNEYRPFAINVKKNICAFLEQEYKMYLFKELTAEGNIPLPDHCPVTEGFFTVSNYSPKKGPPGLPFNNLKLEVRFGKGTTLFLLLEFFVKFDHDVELKAVFT